MADSLKTPARILLTGGPCAGKTTATEAVKARFPGKTLLMPEVASLLLNNGFPKPGVDVPPSDEWMIAFQHAVIPTQKNMEDQYLVMAKHKDVLVVIFDRGLIEGAAYVSQGVEYYLKTFNLTREAAYARYDMVIHLESVAACTFELYDSLKETNYARYESAEEALQRDLALQEVWGRHPNWHLVSGKEGIEKVVANVIKLVGTYIK